LVLFYEIPKVLTLYGQKDIYQIGSLCYHQSENHVIETKRMYFQSNLITMNVLLFNFRIEYMAYIFVRIQIIFLEGDSIRTFFGFTNAVKQI